MSYKVKARDDTTNEEVFLAEFETRNEAERFALKKTFEGTRAWIAN